MAGRDIGAGLLKVLKRLKCFDSTPIEDLLTRVEEWERKATKAEAEVARLRIERDAIAGGRDCAEAEVARLQTKLGVALVEGDRLKQHLAQKHADLEVALPELAQLRHRVPELEAENGKLERALKVSRELTELIREESLKRARRLDSLDVTIAKIKEAVNA